jgi:hypothetical protein
MTEQSKTYQDLKQECAPIAYKEIEQFFARGMLVLVAEGLDIIDVALSIQADDTQQINRWISSEKVIRVHDEYARKWNQKETLLMAVTAVPWLLVQEIDLS